jgi:hypothetical protein
LHVAQLIGHLLAKIEVFPKGLGLDALHDVLSLLDQFIELLVGADIEPAESLKELHHVRDRGNWPGLPSVRTGPSTWPGRENFREPPAWAKQSSLTGYSGDWPEINVPEFNSAIWNDPEVYRRMPLSTRAAASGLVTGASHLRGGSPLITPMDVARISAGRGPAICPGRLWARCWAR